MARQARLAVILALGAALALAGCGRKGPLERPGETAPEAAPTPAPESAPAPTPTPTPGTGGL